MASNDYYRDWQDDLDWDKLDQEWAEQRLDAGLIDTLPNKVEPVKDPEQPKDEQGNLLTRDEINEALDSVRSSMLDIDNEVKKIKDPEQQAFRARNIMREYTKQADKLEGYLRDFDRWEEAQAQEKGIGNFGMETDEGNIAVQCIVESEVEQFEDKLQALKEECARGIRARLDGLDEPVEAQVRDRIYDALVAEEVMETWEPMEF